MSRRHQWRAALCTLCVGAALLLAPALRASFLPPAGGRSLLVEAGVPRLALGAVLDPGTLTTQLELGWDLGSDVLRGDVGLTHTTYGLGPFDLRLLASGGPLVVPSAGLVLGGHAGLSALLDFAWGPLSLFAGPGVDLAASFEGGQRVDSRAQLLGAGGIGVQGPKAGVWLIGEAGYALGGAGGGGVVGRYGLALAVPWP